MKKAITEYCRQLELAGRSRLTVISYRRDLLKLLNWAQKDSGLEIKIKDITPLTLKEYRRYLMEHHKPATVNKTLVVIKAFFRWAQEIDLIAHSPAWGLKLLRTVRCSPRWLGKEEQLRLVREVRKKGNKRDAAMIGLMLYAGLRCSEVCNLKREDVKISERMGKVVVRHDKGKRKREVPLNSIMQKVLRKYLENIKQKKVAGEWLFSTRRSKKMSPRALQHMVAKYGKKAGLGGLSPNVLRHTFCRELAGREDVPLDIVAVLAGHMTKDGRPNLKTTALYTTTSEKKLQELVGKLGKG